MLYEVITGLLTLTSPGPEGEASWLESYYGSEGQDAGAAMESLIAAAAGDAEGVWSLEAARRRVAALVADSLDALTSYVGEARGLLGEASAPMERYLAASIAATAPDDGYVPWISSILGLTEADGLAGLLGGSGDEAMAAAFIGLGDRNNFV